MAFDDAAAHSQTNAGAVELSRRVQPLEGAEQLIGIGHIKANAIITDPDSRSELPVFSCELFCIDPNHVSLFGHGLACVVDQVYQYLGELLWVSPTVQLGRDFLGDPDAILPFF